MVVVSNTALWAPPVLKNKGCNFGPSMLIEGSNRASYLSKHAEYPKAPGIPGTTR